MVVTLTAATMLENAHGKITSPNAAPTSLPSDSAGWCTPPATLEAV